MAIGAQGEEIRQIFWIPPKQNPEVIMRQMAQSGGNGGSGNGGSGSTPGVDVKIPTPGGGTPGRGGRKGSGGKGSGGGGVPGGGRGR